MKSKTIPVCVDVMDINDDGALEIVSAWSGGKVEARSLVDGALVFKDQLPSACAGLIVADYRLDSRQHCVVVTVDGLVRGYSVGQAHALFDNADAVRDETQMEQLNQEILSLQQQLRNFETAVEEAKGSKSSGDVQMHVPTDTSIVCRWAVNESRKCVDMVISTNNKTVINTVVLMADHIFGGESKVFYPSEPSSKVHVPFVNECDKGTDVYVKVFVSARSSSVFHVFERGYRMPQFSMFVPFVLTGNLNQWPKSAVRFKINEHTPDLAKWLNTSFNIQYVSLFYAALNATGACLLMSSDHITGTSFRLSLESILVFVTSIQTSSFTSAVLPVVTSFRYVRCMLRLLFIWCD
jgi:Bardet-Biedl syndrome 2 protein